MKLAIMSDAHDNWANLEKAIAVAHERGCEVLLFAGDLIAPPGLAVLENFQGPVKIVWGNNEGERMGITQMCAASKNLELCGDVFEGELGGAKIFMNHYPRIVELAAQAGEFDLSIHGHTHVYRMEPVGKGWLVNPGEIQGYRTGEASFVVWDTEQGSGERVRV
jgi:putative phosphoesterase